MIQMLQLPDPTYHYNLLTRIMWLINTAVEYLRHLTEKANAVYN